MVVSLPFKFGRACLRPLDLFTLLALLSGVCSGIYLLAWYQQFSGLLGHSQPVSTGLGLALTLTLAAGLRLPLLRLGGSLHPGIRFASIHFLLAAASASFPWLMTAIATLAPALGTRFFDSPLSTSLFAFATGLLGGGLPLLGVVLLPQLLSTCADRFHAAQRSEPAPASEVVHPLSIWFLASIGAGIVLSCFLLSPWIGGQVTLQVTALLGSLLFVACLVDISRPRSIHSRIPHAAVEFPCPSPAAATIGAARPNWGACAVQLLLLAALGLATAAWFRVVQQLLPVTIYLHAAEWAELLAGGACGLACARGMNAARRESWRISAHLVLATVLLASLAAFPNFVHQLLWLNSHVSQVWLLLVIRSLLPGLVLFPIGLAWGLNATAAVKSHGRPQVGALIPLAVFLIAQAWCLPAYGPARLLIIAAALLAVGAGAAGIRSAEYRVGWRRRGLVVGTLACLAAAPVWSGRYQPALSARLLFSTNVAVAQRSGQSSATLPFLDAGRNLTVREGEHGTYTVWKYDGAQLHVRENGVPKAVVSRDTELYPQYSAELLQGIVPLVLHEQPAQVLVLGLGAGVPLQACLASPVQQITCAEEDRHLVSLVRELMQGAPGEPAWNDARLQMRLVDPALLLLASQENYDVIISSPDQSSLAQSQAHYTYEFYSRVARRLAPAGIFCQRFQYVDYGATPLRSLTRTLQAAFSEVMALEMAPGEFLFLATNDPRGLVRPDLLARAQATHVRELLAQLGWDWSVLINLAGYNQEALSQVAATGPAPLNTASGGDFAFRLPLELMRWGPKLEEVRGAFNQRSGRILSWMGTGEQNPGNSPYVLRRLSEVAAQQDLMFKYSDQYWAYRKAAREQISKRPKTLISQMSYSAAQGDIDPEDRRRMQYFKALGQAAKTKSLEDIQHVADFESPFDPLLSYFLHLEVAELYARAEHSDPRQELRHRLHALYFSSVYDRSVHNAVDAIQLVIEHPEAVPDASERWDCLNSLLQMLQIRWQARAAGKAGVPKDVVRDIDLSIVAAEKAFNTLDELTQTAQLSTTDWELRKQVVDRNLVRVLRAYRTQLLPYLTRHEMLSDRERE